MWNQSNYRTRENIARESVKSKPGLSVKERPIPTLPANWSSPLIEVVPPDLLHLRMRGGGKLLRNCIMASAQHTGNKLATEFQALCRETGMRFSIFETTVRTKTEVAFTSLTGREYQSLLNRLGPKIKTSTGVFADSYKVALGELVE
jgi:hypothetical protein